MRPEAFPGGEPPLPPPPAVALPIGDADPNYHCANCKFLPDPSDPRGGFWACQNLCVRD